MEAVKPDPPMKRVGRSRRYVCVVCQTDLGEVAIKNFDPFCSVGCARGWHGTELPKTARGTFVASSM